MRRKDEGHKPWDEGIELLDGEGDPLEEESNDIEEVEEEEEEESLNNAQISNVSQESDQQGGEVSDNTQQLDKLSEQFPKLRKDLEFLNELPNLIETHVPSTTQPFTSHIMQLKTTYRTARLSLRMRMRTELDGSKK